MRRDNYTITTVSDRQITIAAGDLTGSDTIDIGVGNGKDGSNIIWRYQHVAFLDQNWLRKKDNALISTISKILDMCYGRYMGNIQWHRKSLH